MVSSMTQEQRQELLAKIDGTLFSVLPESMLAQAANQALRAEYQALGMDLNAMQSRSIWTKGLLMLLVALLGTVAAVLVGYSAPPWPPSWAGTCASGSFTR